MSINDIGLSDVEDRDHISNREHSIELLYVSRITQTTYPISIILCTDRAARTRMSSGTSIT